MSDSPILKPPEARASEITYPKTQVSQRHPLLPNVLAGLTTGVVTLVYSISFAALIFSDTLTAFFPQGLGVALIGATVTAVVVSWRSSFPFALAGLESNSIILVALMGSAIATTLQSSASPEQLYATAWITISLSTVLTGLFLWGMGWLRWGQWVRFIPYPVMGGFLAGTGWLIMRSSFKVMAGFPLGLAHLMALLQPPHLAYWLMGLAFASILFAVLGRYKHFLVLPTVLLGGIVGFDGLWVLGDRLFSLNPQGWFFEPFPTQEVWKFWQISTLSQVNWFVALQQSGTLVSMMLIVVISILLNATGLELATSVNADLNRELRVHGLANLVAGLCGGMVGYLSINRTLLNRQAGATQPLAALIAGGLCASVLLFGSGLLAYLPRPILGGLLLYMGLKLLLQWVYQAWFQFSRLDYFLIVFILGVIASWGFLQGVGAGVMIACFLFIFNYGRTPVVKHVLTGATYFSNVRRSFVQQQFLHQKGDSIYILVLQGFIFFGTANKLLEAICQRLEDSTLAPLKFVVFDFRLVNGLDSSAILSFIKLRQIAQKSQLNLVLTDLQPAIQQQLNVGRLFKPDDEIYHCFSDLDQGLEWCENQLLEAAQLRRSRFIPLEMQLATAFPNTSVIASLMPYLKLVQLETGTYLFYQGDPFDGLYFLEFGRLSVVRESPNGKTRRICSYTHVVTVGEMGLYQHAPRTASIIADQPSRLRFLSTEAFEQIQTQDPLLAANLHKFIASLLATRLQEQDEILISLLH